MTLNAPARMRRRVGAVVAGLLRCAPQQTMRAGLASTCPTFEDCPLFGPAPTLPDRMGARCCWASPCQRGITGTQLSGELIDDRSDLAH
jgi:hypothetical protein